MIRKATTDDIETLLKLGEIMHAESRFASLVFSRPKMLDLLKWLLSTTDGFVMIAERDSEIVGGMVGYVSEHFFSLDKLAMDLGLFILPDKRGGILAARLLKAFCDFARERGAKAIQVGITTGVNIESSSRLYEALGFKHKGNFFELGVDHV